MQLDEAHRIIALVADKEEAEVIFYVVLLGDDEAEAQVGHLTVDIREWLEREALHDEDTGAYRSLSSDAVEAACRVGAAFVIAQIKAAAHMAVSSLEAELAALPGLPPQA